MPVKSFVGGARIQAEVLTITIGTFDAATTYNATFGTKTVGQVGTTDANTTASNLKSKLEAADAPPEFQEYTYSVTNNVITLTARVPGRPGILATSVSGGTGTISNGTTTSNSGPEVWDLASNWNGGTLPVNADTIDLSGFTGAIKYNLSGLAAVALARFIKPMNSTGQMGLPDINEDNPSLPYGEYRPKAVSFTTPPTQIDIGDGEGNGSSLMRFEFGTTANGTTTTINVNGTGSPDITDGRALMLTVGRAGTGANVLNLTRGSVGVATFPGEASDFSQASSSIRIGYQTSQDSDADVLLGSGVIMPPTVLKTGGTLLCSSNMTTLNHKGGETTVTGSATLTTGNHDKGTINWNSNGTVTTWEVGSEATLNWNGDPRPKTVTNCTAHLESQGIDDQGVVTFTNGVRFRRGDLRVQGEFDWSFGPDRLITIT